MDSSDGSLWSSTWRKKITGLPVAFTDDAGTLRYYTYTVTETWMMFGKGDVVQCATSAGADATEGCKTPADSRLLGLRLLRGGSEQHHWRR